MIYTADFNDINDKKSYNITITTSSGTGTKELVLGDSPFTTEMNQDEENLYAPMRTTGATVQIVTELMPFDLYSGEARGTKVVLTDKTNNKAEWIGYVTPCAYNQGFDYEKETIELECIDGLSVLQYCPYKATNDSIGNKQVITFLEIIKKCLKEARCFNYLYISDNVQIKSVTSTESICEIFKVSEQNFFDEKDDDVTPDDDVAWTSLDVLTELCRFLGYTCICKGDTVYLVDYDAIINNKNTYWKYNLNTGTKTYETFSESKHIDEEAYSEAGNDMSLAEVYNKVKVKDEFYTYDSLIPDFGDTAYEHNITDTTDTKLQNWVTQGSSHYKLADTFTYTTKNKTTEAYQIMVVDHWKNKKCVLIVKFYDSPVFKFHKYSYQTADNVEITDNDEFKTMRWSKLWDFQGAVYVHFYKKNIDGGDYNRWRANYHSSWYSQTKEVRKAAWDTLLGGIDVQGISLKPMILRLNHDTNHIGPYRAQHDKSYKWADTMGNVTVDDKLKEDCRFKPFVSLSEQYSSEGILGGEGSYIILKGKFRYHDEIETPFPMESQGNDLHRAPDVKRSGHFFIWARLKWGESYWNGSGWQTQKADFPLYWRSNDISKDERRNKNHYDVDFDFLDTASQYTGGSDKGYYIPCPQNTNLTGRPEFIIFANRDMHGDSNHSAWSPKHNFNDNFACRYYSKVEMIQEFEFKPYISNGMFDDLGNDTDTIYTNYTGNNSVKEMEEITFKVCTYDYKNNTWSMVVDDKNDFVQYTFNKALNSLEKSVTGSYGTAAVLCQEEHYVTKLVSQYETPRVILELNLRNEDYNLWCVFTDKTLSNRKYVPMTISTDYKYNKQMVKLIEKF